MTKEEFDSIFKDTIKTISTTLLKKRQEYAPDAFNNDCLRNFKLGSSLLGSSEMCLCSYLLKHIVSIFDMSKNPMSYDIQVWNEKITDSINYLLLLKALVIEEKKNSETLNTNDTKRELIQE